MTKISIIPDSKEFDCSPGDTILRAALRAGIAMPYSCNVGSCGTCRFELVEGEVSHQRKDAPAWSERELKRNRWLGCQAEPNGPCKIKFRQDEKYKSRFRPVKMNGILKSVTAITHDISEFTFQVDGKDDFIAGQYGLLGFPQIEGQRAYSMSNLPGSGEWQFQIKRTLTGVATKYLFEDARIGDQIAIDGPYGTASFRADSDRPIVLLAGGSGLSPMVSILRAASESGVLKTNPARFFYGCRTQKDLFDPKMLDDIAGSNVRFTAALSDPDESEDWDGATGFLHDVALNALGEGLKNCDIYFAGPPVMSAAVQKMAYEAGVPMEHLYFDEFY